MRTAQDGNSEALVSNSDPSMRRLRPASWPVSDTRNAERSVVVFSLGPDIAPLRDLGEEF